MLNRASLIGHLGQDPEIRTTDSGKQVASFSVATSERWTDKTTGEKKEKTDWHRIVVWNEHLIPVIEQYLKKGAKVFIEGSMKTRKYQAQDGSDRYATEVVLQGFDAKIQMLDRSGNGLKPAESPDDYGQGDSYETKRSAGGRSDPGHRDGPDGPDDAIPF
jgi:single-strand DNA-binding protein